MFSDPPDDRCLAYYPPTIPSMRSLENRCSQFFRYGEERTHPPAFARQMSRDLRPPCRTTRE
jgi:hypothetical protein